jgi:hypothetical protein
MTSIARNAHALVPHTRLRQALLASVLAMQFAPAVRAGDGSITETLVWEQQGQGHDIAVSYSRDRDGMGKLQFRELQRRGNLPITYLVESNKDIVKNLSVAAMQAFDSLFVLTLKTDTGYLVQVFMYDDKLETITEVANTGGHWLPELIYFGDQADPAVGVLKQQSNSRSRSPSLVCGERIYVLNQRTRRVEEVMGRWANHGRGEVPGKADPQCVE